MDATALLNPRKPLFWILAIILSTIIGDVVVEALLNAITSAHIATWLAKLILVVLAIALTLAFGSNVTSLIGLNRGSSAAKRLSDVKVTPVLIVLVSTNPSGAHTTAIATFAKSTVFSHLYLIHSSQSEGGANAIYEEAKNGGKRYHVYQDHLLADFGNLDSVRKVVRRAIKDALELNGVGIEDIVLDITGGTSIASSGAVFAAMEQAVTVTYIPSPGNNRPGTAMTPIQIPDAASR